MDASVALSGLPSGLREPLLEEYRQITSNYAERRWGPSELSGGKFCEIVYTILAGHAIGSYAAKPAKPSDFVGACRKLEANKGVSRSFQILIPRMLPALYEVRNNRGVGHVGGDVDPNHMDATVVVSMCNWIMAELVRVFHALPTSDAQALVDVLAERQTPLIWQSGAVKRVLDPSLKLREQTLVLLASTAGKVACEVVRGWTMYENKTYFRKLLNELEAARQIHLSDNGTSVEILPPGTAEAAKILGSREAKLAQKA
jgi:hypothetical protein